MSNASASPQPQTDRTDEVHLFSPLSIRGVRMRNRVAVSPMCQYSSVDGMPDVWHQVHLGSRAVGGAGLVMTEATAVSAQGRITPSDLGIWNERQMEALKPIVRFIQSQGAVAGIQLAHAGRKASTRPPWEGGSALSLDEGGWEVIGPSAIPFAQGSLVPRELDGAGIERVIDEFRTAAQRALAAGFDLIEIHAAHGYLLHSFLSPLSNGRQDDYGGRLANRMRLVLEVAQALRVVMPATMPLFVRISASDWTEGGWDIEQSVALGRELKRVGVDFIDCSSGGAVPGVRIPAKAGYQVPFAERIRREANIATAAVGLITEAQQAEEIIQMGQADLIMLARAMLRDPYWAVHAARELRQDVDWPMQYGRARD